MNQSYRNSIIFSLVLLFLFIGSTVALQRQFTSKSSGATDFYPRWKGSELFWNEGVDPYSMEASEIIQLNIRGRSSEGSEDQFLFVYPFYTSFLLLPLVGLTYDWVQAIWMVLLQFALLGSLFLILRLLEWKMPVWLMASSFIWVIFFYNSARTILLGQFAGLILLWVVAALLALKEDRDVLAGALLALTTIKPQMVFLIIPALLIWGLGQKRWRFIGSAALSMGVLLGMSFLFLPSWLTSFVTQVMAYPSYTVTPSPVNVITAHFFPALGKPVETGIIVLLMLYLLYEWRRLPKVDSRTTEFVWVMGLTLIISNMVVTRTATTNYIVMYIPLFLVLKYVAERWGNGWVALFYGVSTVFSWTLFLTTISGDFEHPINYLPLPLLLLTAMVVLRPFLIQENVSHVTDKRVTP